MHCTDLLELVACEGIDGAASAGKWLKGAAAKCRPAITRKIARYYQRFRVRIGSSRKIAVANSPTVHLTISELHGDISTAIGNGGCCSKAPSPELLRHRQVA